MTDSSTDSLQPQTASEEGHGARPPVRLEVFSDYTCPWCYIGWARLEKALAALPPSTHVDVEWRPFEIHPEVPPEGMPVEDLGYPPEQWAAMQDALQEHAASEGLDVSKRPKVSNTHRALVASSWARSEAAESYPAFHEALFRGYFSEGRDLGDPGVLRSLAEGSGLDADAMDEALDSGRFESAVAETSERARSLGITGTPTFLFEGRYVASGAIPTDAIVNVVRDLWDHGAP